jgi:predicted phage terminase large subunit-like protein
MRNVSASTNMFPVKAASGELLPSPGYPELKRAVREQAETFGPKAILMEDKASGTQLIQELASEGVHAIKKYEPTMDKIMRMHSVTSTIENGFAHLPDRAGWLGEYLHELTCFPKGKYDDQADSTSQALDWFKQQSMTQVYGLIEYLKKEAEKIKTPEVPGFDSPLVSRSALLREWDRRRFPFQRS